MTKNLTEVVGNRLYANTGGGPRFTLIDIGLESKVAAINPETGFWCLLPADRATISLGDTELTHIYRQNEARFQAEIEKLRFQVAPTAVYFNPTDSCNLNCDYCYLPEDMRLSGARMSGRELDNALEILKEYFTNALPADIRPQLVFHGSEPMLARDEVFSAIERFSGDFRFGIQTNATLLDREAVDFLTKHGVGIGISLDGHSAEVADATRRHWNGNGAFAKVVGAMSELSGYAGLNVICTVTSANVNALSDIVNFLHAHDVRTAMLNPVRCTREGGRRLKPDNAVLARRFTQALDRTYELYQKTGRKLVIANFANVLAGIASPTARRLMCDISPCGGGRCFFAVSTGGDIFPCSEFIGLPEFRGGNLFTDDVSDALSSEPFRQVTGRRVEDFEPCGSCAIRHFCGAPCPAEIHSINGHLSAASDYCEFYEEQVRYAFRVIAAGRERAYMWDDWETTTAEVFSLKKI